MPPMICPSPNIVDQSFPRDVEELRMIAKALVFLVDGISSGSFSFLLTNPLRSFIQEGSTNFEWTKIAEFPGLREIYNTLAQLGLQQGGVNVVDLSNVRTYIGHPIPQGTAHCASSDLWADELGRLCFVHNELLPSRISPFVAVGCTSAFSGGSIGCYEGPDESPCLPLIGPEQIATLSDSEEWDVNPECAQWKISFDQAKKNIILLGGYVKRPSGSSHYEVRFSGKRTWPLDYNHDEIPERHLRQLVPITDLPIEVIKFTLRIGRRPRKISRLDPYLSAG
jgi:hypothetical protein